MTTLATRLTDQLATRLFAARAEFGAARPYPHAAGEALFGATFAAEVRAVLPLIPWRRVETDFYAQYETRPDRLPEPVPPILASLVAAAASPAAAAAAAALCPSDGPLSLASVVLHRLRHGDAIGVHNDANEFGETFRLCWICGAPQGGGELRVHASSAEADVTVAVPSDEDRWFCFRLGPRSWHSVSPVVAPTGERASMVITWAVAPGSKQAEYV